MLAQRDAQLISSPGYSPLLEEREILTNDLPSPPSESSMATDNIDGPPVDEGDRPEQDAAPFSLPNVNEDGLASKVSGNASDPVPSINLKDLAKNIYGCDCDDCLAKALTVLKGAQKRVKFKIESKLDGEDTEEETHEEACLCRACLKDKLYEVKRQPDGDLISYAVEYIDIKGERITEEPWPMPFELGKARAAPGGVAQVKDNLAFSVTTTLNVAVDSESRRYRDEKDHIMKRGILQSLELDVSIRNTSLTIRSKALVNILRDTASYYPSVRLWNEEIEIMEPFCLLAHKMEDLKKMRGELAAAASESDGASAETRDRSYASSPTVATESHRHLSKLLEYVTDFYGDRIERERERYGKGRCTYEMLWYLYKPGDTVYVRDKGRFRGYVIQKVRVEPDILSKKLGLCLEYQLTLWHLDFDGRKVGRCVEKVYVPHFDGEGEITSLKVVPAEIQDREDGGAVRESLVANGKSWFKYLLSGQVHYSGKLLGTFDREFHGRVVTDSANFWESDKSEKECRPKLDDLEEDVDNKIMPGCKCEDCVGARRSRELVSHANWKLPWEKYDGIDPLETKSLELESAGEGVGKNHRYMLCPTGLWGFILKTRQWERLDVSCCKDAKVKTGAIDNLVLQDDRTMRILKALVHKYSNVDEVKGAKPRIQAWGADFVENKGEGQIFLLHGSPGVGKTYVECIAEHTGRPLLSLTAGDVGVDAVQMENNLSKWFNLGEKWGAVMLIDEADVFLEKRQTTDIERNSLVSVFLRCVEYYRGILFLTTNRVGHFDGAFISRIHVVVHYPKHGPEQRKRIWEIFFSKLKKDRPDILVMPEAKKYILGTPGKSPGMLEAEWNGREIRNAFQTAVALAQYRFATETDKEQGARITLDIEDFEDVCELTGQFKQYLYKTQGGDLERMAQQDKSRYEFDE